MMHGRPPPLQFAAPAVAASIASTITASDNWRHRFPIG